MVIKQPLQMLTGFSKTVVVAVFRICNTQPVFLAVLSLSVLFSVTPALGCGQRKLFKAYKLWKVTIVTLLGNDRTEVTKK